jgi:hypothetical protein
LLQDEKGVSDEEAAAKAKEEAAAEPEPENSSKFVKAYTVVRNGLMRGKTPGASAALPPCGTRAARFCAPLRRLCPDPLLIPPRPGLEQDMHKIVDEDPIVAAIHKNAEVFDPKTEYAFSYLQARPRRLTCAAAIAHASSKRCNVVAGCSTGVRAVGCWLLCCVQVFSAICVIFSHGAGEVGYMAGPMTTIWYTVKVSRFRGSRTATRAGIAASRSARNCRRAA